MVKKIVQFREGSLREIFGRPVLYCQISNASVIQLSVRRKMNGMYNSPIILKTGLGGFGAFFGAAEAPAVASAAALEVDGPSVGFLGIADPSLLSAIDGMIY
jgi:hypothetical protein